jgi:kynurenine formamidase
MMDEDYLHLEKVTNLDQLPPYGFTLSVFPIMWIGTTAAPGRAVGILDG